MPLAKFLWMTKLGKNQYVYDSLCEHMKIKIILEKKST